MEKSFRRVSSKKFRLVLLILLSLNGGNCFSKDETDFDESHFKKVVLATNLVEPMNLSVAEDGRVFLVERLGALKVWNPETSETKSIAALNTFTGPENSLLGIVLDPHFKNNGWFYLFYSPKDIEENRVSRFTLNGDAFDRTSEKILLRIHTDRKVANHAAGDLAFDKDGNLFASTGDNTSISDNDSFAPIDERPGRQLWDAQRSAANTMDLRGKILRIHPEANGSYTIPKENLFPKDGSKGRPEIYVMGVRNPFRFTIDEKTGWVYWGDVGPDAREAREDRGPFGFDEFNQARASGNFGWPQFVGNNKAYRRFDFATKQSGDAFDPAHPLNVSPNNTGIKELPPAQPAFIWYPYGQSSKFPELSSGARAAMSGPVYRYDSKLKSDRKLPQHYDGSLFIFDWERSWIETVRFDTEGKLKSISPFLNSMKFKRPICIKLGSDGALYIIEWGSNWYNNKDAQLVRIQYLRDSPLSAHSISSATLSENINFDSVTTGELPPNWIGTQTGNGKAKWSVEKDDADPSKRNVLKQSGEATFPVCIKQDSKLENGFVEVKLKALSGKEDQAGGVIWRVKDRNNYYVACANALENNITIYHTIAGERQSFKSVKVKVPASEWHILRVDFLATHFVVIFDGRKVMEAEDASITGEGAVGVWTKADSVTAFTDFNCSKIRR
ncbi:MAG: PQQ-dependent sugar dehydrogenase [Verrucomicrobiota bacterium]